eukprot:110875-Chlamydomonas_euryale.AAC.1
MDSLLRIYSYGPQVDNPAAAGLCAEGEGYLLKYPTRQGDWTIEWPSCTQRLQSCKRARSSTSNLAMLFRTMTLRKTMTVGTIPGRVALRTLHMCMRSCILQATLRNCWVNAWMRMSWPSSSVSKRCGMLDFAYC